MTGKSNSDCKLCSSQTYYHEFMHFPSLVNDTLYNGPMADVIKPFQLELIARRFGAKGRYFYEAGQRLYLSSMYLGMFTSACFRRRFAKPRSALALIHVAMESS